VSGGQETRGTGCSRDAFEASPGPMRNCSSRTETTAADDSPQTIKQLLSFMLSPLPQQAPLEVMPATVSQPVAPIAPATALTGRLPIRAMVKSAATSFFRIPIRCNVMSKLTWVAIRPLTRHEVLGPRGAAVTHRIVARTANQSRGKVKKK